LYVLGVEFDPGRDPIACGAFTDVYRGLFQKRDVAVKRVRIAGGPVDREQFLKVRASCFVNVPLFDIAQELVAEAVVWQHLKHPNVLPFLGIVQDRDTPFAVLHTVTPWMSHGTLLNFIKSSSYDASNERTQLVC
jgi:hypothetical protein